MCLAEGHYFNGLIDWETLRDTSISLDYFYFCQAEMEEVGNWASNMSFPWIFPSLLTFSFYSSTLLTVAWKGASSTWFHNTTKQKQSHTQINKTQMLFHLEFVVSQSMIKVIQSWLKQLKVLILADWDYTEVSGPTCRPEYLEGGRGILKTKITSWYLAQQLQEEVLHKQTVKQKLR